MRAVSCFTLDAMRAVSCFALLLQVVLSTVRGTGCGGPSAQLATTHQPGQCPEPYQNVGSYCYYFVLNVTTSWSEGRQYCQRFGGDLAVIHTCDHFGVLVRHIHMTGQEVPERWSYWVGGTDLGDEGSWYWIDGVPMAMGVPFWGEAGENHEPSGGLEQNCASLNRDDRYYIHDGVCEMSGYPLCEFGVNTLRVLDGSPDLKSRD
ncbi:perlucin-like [Panulirus ornatus]|uniref:perlucin-like n=1 Tax=Panulirus ornatus TaxID=150431 RepID=UPI003A855D9B